MGVAATLLWLAMVTGCGRIGFDPPGAGGAPLQPSGDCPTLDEVIAWYGSADAFHLIDMTHPDADGTLVSTNAIPLYGFDDKPNFIVADVAADTINGGPYDDILCGGAGDDTIDGNGGDDQIFGGLGVDQLDGDAGNDTIHGGDDGDTIDGDDGDDTIYGDGGNDTLYGDPGDDTIYGGDGDDMIFGNAGADALYGEIGNDMLDCGNDPGDTADGGPGNNQLSGCP